MFQWSHWWSTADFTDMVQTVLKKIYMLYCSVHWMYTPQLMSTSEVQYNLMLKWNFQLASRSSSSNQDYEHCALPFQYLYHYMKQSLYSSAKPAKCEGVQTGPNIKTICMVSKMNLQSTLIESINREHSCADHCSTAIHSNRLRRLDSLIRLTWLGIILHE